MQNAEFNLELKCIAQPKTRLWNLSDNFCVTDEAPRIAPNLTPTEVGLTRTDFNQLELTRIKPRNLVPRPTRGRLTLLEPPF